MGPDSRADGRSGSDAGRAATAGPIRGVRKRDRHRLRPALQVLEGRRLLATFTVTIPVDTLIPPTNQPLTGTLRWAVEEADAATSPSTIDFDLGNIPSITLSLGTLDVGDPSASITIDGPGANLLSITGNGASQVFDCTSGTTSISGLTITGGSSSGHGGGLYNGGTSALTVSDCTISGNSAANGGGLGNSGTATIDLDGCTISGNSAAYGGGLLNVGAATLTGCTISGNSALGGGGLSNDGTATLTGCTISGNFALGGGGGLYNIGSTTLALSDCTISGNSAQFGGGLLNDGAATVDACTISGNSARAGVGGLEDVLTPTSPVAATLTDTIVAGDLGSGEIGGDEASTVTGMYNLIGPGGSGGIQGGSDGNIVLTSLNGLGLTPLGDYGGPTQTMALLPGSPAIGAGTPIGGITSDQRGEPIGSSVDIGAFQSQGFTLVDVLDSTPQAAVLGDAFADPLAVTVTATNPVEPTVGGVVTFGVTPGPTGASASLSAPSAIIGSDGVAQVTATANSAAGSYTIAASSVGALAPAQFSLKNLVDLSFSGTTDQSITYGTATVTISGTLSDGALAPPPGESVAVTLAGATQQAGIGSGGAFTTTFDTASLPPTGAPYTISYAYNSDGTYTSASAISTLSVAMATPTVSLSAPAGSVAYGQAVTLVAKVTGAAVGTITFLDGSTPLGAVPLDASGQATLTVADLALGSHSITASYGGGDDFLAGTSPPASVAVARAATEVVLVPHPLFHKKKVVSIGLEAEVEPMSSGGIAPTGTVTFMVKKKSLGTASLAGGEATLTVVAGTVLNKAIMIEYGGDADYLSSTGAPPVLTQKTLRSLARPMVAVLERPAPGRRGHRGRPSRSEARHGS